MFKRFVVIMVLSNSVMPPVESVNIVTDQQALNNLLAQLASTHEGVYIETVLQGFTKLTEGAEQLLTQNEQVGLGAKHLLEGVAQLTACALQGRNGTENNEQAISQVEELVYNFRSNLIVLLDTQKQSGKPVTASSSAASNVPGSNLTGTVGNMATQDNLGHDESVDEPKEKDHESNGEKLLVEGLTQIFYNVFCMLISPNDIGLYLKNVFAGLLKVISAVLADGKIGREELEILSAALGSIFNVRDLQKQLIQKQSLITVSESTNQTLRFTDIKATTAANVSHANYLTNLRMGLRNELEIQQMSTGLSQISQSFMALLADPKNAATYLKAMFQGLIHLLVSLFADGKVDAHDLDNLVAVIKENETKALLLLNTPGGLKLLRQQFIRVS